MWKSILASFLGSGVLTAALSAWNLLPLGLLGRIVVFSLIIAGAYTTLFTVALVIWDRREGRLRARRKGE